MSIVVRFLSGARRGTEMQLDADRFRVGDDASCEVFFDPRSDPAACGRSAIIQRKEDGWYVRSTSGPQLLLNHAPLVSESRLRSGDVLRMSQSGPDLLFALAAKVNRAATHQDPPQQASRPAASGQEPDVATPAALVQEPTTLRPSVRRSRSVWGMSVVAGLAVLVLGTILLWPQHPDPENQRAAAGNGTSGLELVPTSPQVTEEGRELSFRMEVKVPAELRQKLVFSLVAQAPAGSMIDPLTGEFRWTPTEEQGPGRYPVTVQAICSLDSNLTAETTFWIDVQEVNSPPVIQSTDEKAMEAGQLLTFQLLAVDSDRPPNRHKFSVSSGPGWVSVESASGWVRCEPPTTEDGPFEAAINVMDDGKPPLGDDTLLKLTVHGDPWQRVTRELAKTVWLAQLEVDGPQGSHSFPFATCCAIDAHTLLASAREVLQLASWHRQGHRIWLVSPSYEDRFSITDFRVRREFVALASQPGDWIFANLGLLITDGELPNVASMATAAEPQKIEEGLPIVCYGFSHDGGKITRFDRFEPEPYRGEVYLVTRSPELPGLQTLLEIKAAIPQNVYGSPIVTSQGNVIGVYGESSSSADVGVKDLHYATALDSAAITDWLAGNEADWISPSVSPPDESLP